MILPPKRVLAVLAAATVVVVSVAILAGPLRNWWAAHQQKKSVATVSVPSDEEHAAHGSSAAVRPQEQHGGHEMAGANVVEISPERLQAVGVRFERAERRGLEREIRTFGRAEVDERRLARVNLKIDGWIENLNVNYTGQRVDKGPSSVHPIQPGAVGYAERVSTRD